MVKADLVDVEDNTPYVTLTFSKQDFYKFKKFMGMQMAHDMDGLSGDIWDEIENLGDAV